MSLENPLIFVLATMEQDDFTLLMSPDWILERVNVPMAKYICGKICTWIVLDGIETPIKTDQVHEMVVNSHMKEQLCEFAKEKFIKWASKPHYIAVKGENFQNETLYGNNWMHAISLWRDLKRATGEKYEKYQTGD